MDFGRKMIREIDHIGIVVESLEAGIAEFSEQLGLACEGVMEKEGIGLKVAFFSVGALRIELLEFQRPIAGVDEIVWKGLGIQHLAFRVDDLRGAIDKLEKRGLRLLKGFPREGAYGGRVAFFSFGKRQDYLIELCEKEDGK